MEVKAYKPGSHTTENLRDFSSLWPDAGLNQGGTFSDDMDASDAEELVLVPILIGETDSGKKTYVCDEAQHGVALRV